MNIFETTIKRIAPSWSVRRLSLLLTIIAIILWSYSTSQAKLDIGVLGIIHSYPPTFFVALGLLAAASFMLWVSPQNHEKLLLLQFSLLIAALWLNPLLLGATQLGAAPAPNGLFGNVDYIIRQGELIPGRLVYHNWPLSWIFIAMLMEIPGINDVSILNAVTPIALQFIFLLPLYLVFRDLLGDSHRNLFWAGVWLFALGNFVPQSYLSAQAFGYFYFLAGIHLIYRILFWQLKSVTPYYQTTYRLLFLLVFASLVMTHLFTGLIFLSMLIPLHVVNRVKSYSLPVTVIVFTIAWTIYGSMSHLSASLPRYLELAFRMDTTAAVISTGFVTGSESHQAVIMARIAVGVIYVAIALAGFMLGRKVDRSSNLTVAIMITGPIGLSLIFGYAYGAEIVHRIYFFALPMMAYLGIKLLKQRAWALILFTLLLLLLPLHIASHHGSVASSREFPGEIASSPFFHDHTHEGVVLAGYMHGRVRDVERYSTQLTTWFKGALGYPNGDMLTHLNNVDPERAHYVGISRRWKEALKYGYDDHDFVERIEHSLDNALSCTLFYVNRDISLYYHHQKE